MYLYLIIQDTRCIWLWFTSTRLECFYIIFNIHIIGTFSCFSITFSMVLLSSMVRSSPCPVTQGGIAGQLSDDGVRLLARRGGHKSSSLGVRQTQDFPLSLSMIWYDKYIYIYDVYIYMLSINHIDKLVTYDKLHNWGLECSLGNCMRQQPLKSKYHCFIEVHSEIHHLRIKHHQIKLLSRSIRVKMIEHDTKWYRFRQPLPWTLSVTCLGMDASSSNDTLFRTSQRPSIAENHGQTATGTAWASRPHPRKPPIPWQYPATEVDKGW